MTATIAPTFIDEALDSLKFKAKPAKRRRKFPDFEKWGPALHYSWMSTLLSSQVALGMGLLAWGVPHPLLVLAVAASGLSLYGAGVNLYRTHRTARAEASEDVLPTEKKTPPLTTPNRSLSKSFSALSQASFTMCAVALSVQAGILPLEWDKNENYLPLATEVPLLVGVGSKLISRHYARKDEGPK